MSADHKCVREIKNGELQEILSEFARPAVKRGLLREDEELGNHFRSLDWRSRLQFYLGSIALIVITLAEIICDKLHESRQYSYKENVPLDSVRETGLRLADALLNLIYFSATRPTVVSQDEIKIVRLSKYLLPEKKKEVAALWDAFDCNLRQLHITKDEALEVFQRFGKELTGPTQLPYGIIIEPLPTQPRTFMAYVRRKGV